MYLKPDVGLVSPGPMCWCDNYYATFDDQGSSSKVKRGIFTKGYYVVMDEIVESYNQNFDLALNTSDSKPPNWAACANETVGGALEQYWKGWESKDRVVTSQPYFTYN